MDSLKHRRYLICFILVWVSCLTLIPGIFYRALPLDTVETLIWANPLEMGNAKHPPLASWLAYLFDNLFFHHDIGVFFLSQVLLTGGYFFLYRLGKEFFSPMKAAMAVFLQACVLFYSFNSSTYNVNLPHMLFWPMAVFYFVRAVHTDKMLYWILFGIAGAFCVLSKLFGLLIPFSLFLYVLSRKNLWCLFQKKGPYIAIAIFFCVLSPYLIWLVQNDFMPFQYVVNRASEDDKVGSWRFIEVFFVSLAMVPAPFCVMAVTKDHPVLFLKDAWRKRSAFHWTEPRSLGAFLLFTPIVLFTVLSVFGCDIDLMWTFPIYSTLGFFVVSWFPDSISKLEFRKVFALMLIVFLAFQSFDLLYFMTSTNRRLHMSGKEMAAAAQEYYKRQTGQDEIPFVYGDLWYAGCISHYLPYHPYAGSTEDAYDLKRFQEHFEKYGALGVLNHRGDANDLQKLTSEKLTFTEKVFRFHARFDKDSSIQILFTIIPPRNSSAD